MAVAALFSKTILSNARCLLQAAWILIEDFEYTVFLKTNSSKYPDTEYNPILVVRIQP